MIPKYEDRERAEIFGEVAEQYDRSRTSYPKPLIDELTGFEPDRVLDVGCGTGNAGRLFVERGCRVLGVEPDERMAALASQHGLEVEVTTFEAWDPRGRQFDLLVAAQSWHWVNPTVGFAKAGVALRSNGRVALVWTIGKHRPDAKAVLSDLYADLAPSLIEDSGVLGTVRRGGATSQIQRLRNTGMFDTPRLRPYEWRRVYSTGEWLDHLQTHSDHRRLPPADLARLLDHVGEAVESLGGSLVVDYVTWTITASRL